jgi:hypothetical protein
VATLSPDPAGPDSRHLARLLRTHWLRTLPITAGALCLLSARVRQRPSRARVALTDNLTFAADERWRNSMTINSNTTEAFSGNVFVPDHVASVGYADVNVAYPIHVQAATFEAFLDVRNLWDRSPPAGTPGHQPAGTGTGDGRG